MSNMTGPGGANSAFDIRCDTREIARLQAEYKRTDDITKRLRENGTLRDEEAATEIETLRAQLASAKKALEELSDPLLIKVAGHLTGTARALAIIHAMKEIARAALNPEPAK